MNGIVNGIVNGSRDMLIMVDYAILRLLVIHANVVISDDRRLLCVADNFHKHASFWRRHVFTFYVLLSIKKNRSKYFLQRQSLHMHRSNVTGHKDIFVRSLVICWILKFR